MTGQPPGLPASIWTTTAVERIEFGHAWLDDVGARHAAVYLGAATITFRDPTQARAAAAACTQAAEALEALPPPEAQVTP